MAPDCVADCVAGCLVAPSVVASVVDGASVFAPSVVVTFAAPVLVPEASLTTVGLLLQAPTASARATAQRGASRRVFMGGFSSRGRALRTAFQRLEPS